MASLSRTAVLLLIAAAFALTNSAFADGQDETALVALWDKNIKVPADHLAVAAEAQAFEKQFPQSPLICAARGIAAFQLLAGGDTVAAKQVLGRMELAGVGPMKVVEHEMALRWLTRLDRAAVADALRAIYADNLEFPDTLKGVAALPESSRPRLTDRWGAQWTYHPAEFQKIDAGPKQSYVLESTKLGAKSDLSRLARRPYAAGFSLKPVQAMPTQAGDVVWSFAGADGSRAVLQLGRSAGDLSFPYLGDSIMVLSDGDYWLVVPKPAS